MPQCQFPVFCYFCVSEKLHRKYSRNWTKQVPELLFFPGEYRRPNESRRGARGQRHHEGARPSPWPRPPVVRPPWSTPDDAPSPIKSFGMENSKSIGGQNSLFWHPAGTGKCPQSHLHRSRSPSPLTSLPCPSLLLPPMMRRE
jgi:hypothetical protein